MSDEIDIQIPGYEILDELGAGGMAKVYLGLQTALDRKVAIKVLHAALSMQSDEFKQRFFHEGKVLARVSHPNIVSIYDIGEANGLLYMTMEYVPGGTLTDRLKVDQLTVDECVQVCGQVGLALHTTHLEHVVHRDLKPSNVLMKDGVMPMLTDFGIARETDTDVGLTQTGHIVGTLQYMSPEQIRGLPVDHRSDIYSLGLLFYRLLAGRLPFVASSHYDLSRMQCEDQPPPLPPELGEFQGVMDIILAKDPNDRFQTALEFCKALQALDVTDEEYKTELTQQTRIYDSSRMPFQSYGSEQFSARTSGSRSGRYSGRTSGSGEQYVSRESGRFTSQGTRDRFPTGQEPPRKSGLKKALIFGLPVLAVVAAAIVYFAFMQSTGDYDADDIRRVDMYLTQLERIVDQTSDEALAKFKQAQEIAPEYGPVQDKAQEIATVFEFQAEDLMADQRYEEAQVAIENGLSYDPENEMLLQDQAMLQGILEEQQRLAAIDEALMLAQNYQAQGRLVDPPGANAFEAFQQVQTMDPSNQAAQQGLAEIATILLSDVRTLVSEGNYSGAEVALALVEQRYPGNTDVAALRGEIGVQIKLAADAERVQSLLLDAVSQMGDQKYLDPEGDNALASYTAVLQIQPDNREALTGLDEMANIFAQRAESALTAEDFLGAVELADNGLLAAPDNVNLMGIRDRARSQLGERERMINDLIQEAQSLVMSGQFLPMGEGQGNNAYDKFNQVLVEAPGNAQAERGLSVLPQNVLDEIEQLKIRAFYGEAETLALAAQRIYSDDNRFVDAQTELVELLAQEERRDRLERMLADSASLIATRPLTLEIIDQSATALESIRNEFPGDASASSQVDDLIDAIAAEARTRSAGGNEDLGLDVIDRGLSHFSSNPMLISERDQLVRAREARLAALEAERIANTGQLAIDALPSGTVIEVVDSAGQVLALPADAQTPLVIDLLKGNYSVTVQGDNGEAPQTLNVTVLAQQVETTTANFDTITADQYFERSGW